MGTTITWQNQSIKFSENKYNIVTEYQGMFFNRWNIEVNIKRKNFNFSCTSCEFTGLTICILSFIIICKYYRLFKKIVCLDDVANLDWLFMLVLPVARLREPCSRHAIISF